MFNTLALIFGVPFIAVFFALFGTAVGFLPVVNNGVPTNTGFILPVIFVCTALSVVFHIVAVVRGE